MTAQTIIDRLAELTDAERATVAKAFGWTVPRKRTPKVIDDSKPAPVKTTRRQMDVAHLYPANAQSQGPTTPELEAWLEAHHNPDFAVKVSITVGEGKPNRVGIKDNSLSGTPQWSQYVRKILDERTERAEQIERAAA